MKPQRLILAANAAAPDTLAANADGGAVFAIAQQDSMFIPYGIFPHKVGRQVFDRAAAEAMVAANTKPLAKVAAWLTGASEVPIYVGHPDIPGSKDSDKRAFGWADAGRMVAGNDGLTIPIRWSEPGRELVENGHFRFYSPTWWLRSTPRGLVPTALKSIGLTNDPNIPVPALANEAEMEEEQPPAVESVAETPEETTPEDETPPVPVPEEILAALELAPEATAADVLSAIAALRDAAAAANGAATQAAGECAAEKAEKEAVANDLAAARAALAQSVNHAVETAVSAGRIAIAAAPAKTAELLASNDLAAALQALGILPARIKTASVTGDLGSARSALVIASNDTAKADRNERAVLVANEFENTNPALSAGFRKRLAWQRAQARNPALFGKKSTDAPA